MLYERLPELFDRAAAQPAPVQKPVCIGWDDKTDTPVMGYTTPPAAQRQWVGLTDKEFEEIIMSAPNATVPVVLWQLIQDKLKEKNI